MAPPKKSAHFKITGYATPHLIGNSLVWVQNLGRDVPLSLSMDFSVFWSALKMKRKVKSSLTVATVTGTYQQSKQRVGSLCVSKVKETENEKRGEGGAKGQGERDLSQWRFEHLHAVGGQTLGETQS